MGDDMPSVAPSNNKEPKQYRIPSQSWPITAEEAADIMLRAVEVKSNKEIVKAATAILKARKKAIAKVV